MSWLERIDAARRAGAFTEQDNIDIFAMDTCFVGEALADVHDMQDDRWASIMKLCYPPVTAVYRNDFAEAERLLLEIQDEVLRIKRESA
jgi:hypothetical protein